MLISLQVKDFAIASEVELSLGPGMSVITGETGAGKSLLVDALMLLCGARADAGVVRNGAERAELIAEFQPDPESPALQWLRDNELDEDGELQLRRVIRADGGSRAWINGRSATAGQLAALGSQLVEIHGQHEHQALLQRPHQLALLDAFGAYDAELQRVRNLAAEWQQRCAELTALAGDGDVAERIEWLRHQHQELDREALDREALDELLAQHRRHSHAASLIESCDRALQRLQGDDSYALGGGLRQLRGELARQASHEPRLGAVDALLEGAEIGLDEAAQALERIRADLDLDPQRLQRMDAQLSRMHDLARKHRIPIEQLAERRDALAAELQRLEGAGASSDALRADIQRLQQDWSNAAAALSAARGATAQRLADQVNGLLGELGMAGARFDVALEASGDGRPDPQGAERCELLIAANAGQPPRPLRKVASGGELSRISLAIEVASLGKDSVATMVFDEVDSGIGGATAEVVGQKLRELGRQRQVLCVTHLAQVAAQATTHLCASKRFEGGITRSRVEQLSGDTRVEELARMMGGIEIDAATRALAVSLLERARV